MTKLRGNKNGVFLWQNTPATVETPSPKRVRPRSLWLAFLFQAAQGDLLKSITSHLGCLFLGV